MGIFPDAEGQLTHKCSLSDLAKFRTHPRCYGCPRSLPDRIKKNLSIMKGLEWSQGFPIITLWELSVAMETRVLIRSCPKPNAANPLPNDAQMKFD